MEPTKILLVDDDPDIRLIVRLSLEAAGGFEVREAASGAEALEAATAERPDAVVLDVMMPGDDGPTTLARLRAIDALRAVPVVFLTGKDEPEDVERLTALGACGVISKPFEPLELADRLRRAIESIPHGPSKSRV